MRREFFQHTPAGQHPSKTSLAEFDSSSVLSQDTERSGVAGQLCPSVAQQVVAGTSRYAWRACPLSVVPFRLFPVAAYQVQGPYELQSMLRIAGQDEGWT